jgi:hypothetical protein
LSAVPKAVPRCENALLIATTLFDTGHREGGVKRAVD